MIKSRCGKSSQQQEQSTWGRLHDNLQAAKEKTQTKLVEYTTGNDRKINRAALIALGSAVVGGAAFVANNSNNNLVKLASVGVGVAAGLLTAAYGGYAYEFRNKSRLFQDLKYASHKMGDNISSAYKKIINKHLNRANPVINNMLKSQKTNTQG